MSGKYIFRDRVGNGLTLTRLVAILLVARKFCSTLRVCTCCMWARLRQNIAAGPGDLDVGDDLDCPAGRGLTRGFRRGAYRFQEGQAGAHLCLIRGRG